MAIVVVTGFGRMVRTVMLDTRPGNQMVASVAKGAAKRRDQNGRRNWESPQITYSGTQGVRPIAISG